MKKRVLFVCTHNSARSQMAEGWLRTLGGDRYDAFSAGTEARGVHPLAVQVMEEVRVDLSAHRSKLVGEYDGAPMDVVVTVCDSAREACPYVPATERQMHQSFEDPSAAEGSDEVRLEAFRRVRDEIKRWIESSFISEPTTA